MTGLAVMSSAFAAVLVAAALPFGAGPLGALPASAQQRSEFDARERATLRGGRLVAHRRMERRGNLIHFGGNSFQTVDRPISEVWRAVRNPSTYRDLLPQVESVRVVARGESDAVVRVEHAYGVIRAAYHLRLRFEERTRDVTFDLDATRPNDVRSARGFLTLSEWPEDPNRTLVSWGILAAVDDGFVGGIVRPQLHDWMLRVPTTMRSYLQGRGRTRFLADSGQATRTAH